jgi:glucose-6-phosphate isomerase
LVNEKKKLHPRFVIVVGIGGSSLGTRAVQEAVFGKDYDQAKIKSQILYVETVDPDRIDGVCRLIEPILQENENILINIISKSGNTTETIANALVLLELLKKYKKNYSECVVITTDKDSKLWRVAKKLHMCTLEIPPKIGGRYSVFSPVGLFPLGLLGVDIFRLLQGGALMRKKCLNTNIVDNPAAISAIICYAHYLKGKNINDLFLFAVDLESLGKWYRQLMAESIGKESFSEDEKKIVGITPTVSIGSLDLHSMVQLYLGGPSDKVTTFVSLKKYNTSKRVGDHAGFSTLVKNIQGKPLQDIMDAILKGVKVAYEKNNHPFLEVILPDKSEGSLGQFIQFKMMEIMYLGALLEVNPFNQPQVDDYKRETQKILANKKISTKKNE